MGRFGIMACGAILGVFGFCGLATADELRVPVIDGSLYAPAGPVDALYGDDPYDPSFRTYQRLSRVIGPYAPVGMGYISATAPGSEPVAGNCSGPERLNCSLRLSEMARIAYAEYGPNTDSPLVLLHGLGETSLSWNATIASLRQRDPTLHIIALDLRGFGRSSMPADPACQSDPASCYSPQTMARDVARFLSRRGLHNVTLVGHAMGAMVAQEVALQAPDRLGRVVLIGTTANGRNNAGLRQMLGQGPAAGTDTQRAGVWNASANAMLAYDGTARLQQMQVPALVLWGSQDPLFSRRDDQDPLVAALRQSGSAWAWKQYGSVPLAPAGGAAGTDLGANLPQTAPDAVAADILSFANYGRPDNAHVFATPGNNGVLMLHTAPGAAITASGP